MLSVRFWNLAGFGIMESLDLKKTSKIMESNHSLNTSKKHITKRHIFMSFKSVQGWGLLTLPWAACCNA